MSTTTIRKLQSLLPTLTATEARIAHYIIRNIDEIPFETGTSLARKSNVSEISVSRFLRTPEKVSPETRERITKVMEEVGYPLEEARGPAKAPRIGILVPSFNNQIFSDLLAGIESVTSAQGFQTLVVNYDYDRQREEEQIAAVLAFHVKGLLLTESLHTLRADKYLNAAKIPIAEVMGLAENPGRINVGFDNFKAAFHV